MYPHERSLVKRLADRPFALIGVNSDQDRNKLKEVLMKENISWRSFKDKQAGNKAITQEWKILAFPTLYLIDHKGIIRHKYLGAPPGEVLDKAIEKLVEVAEKKS